MGRSGSSVVGLVTLILALAVVMLLVARHWQAVAPAAAQVAGTAEKPVALETHGETAAGEAIQSGTLPDLKQMQRSTDAHAADVQEALEQSE